MNTIDPITTEIIRNAFVAIASDMNATLIRSAFTPVIYEGKDCSVALIDEQGEVLGQSLGLPLFLGNLEICVKIMAERYGWDYFQEGDVFYMNDSYMTGTHLNDSTIIMPIFWRGERIGFAASRAHWLDVGAKDPGTPVDSLLDVLREFDMVLVMTVEPGFGGQKFIPSVLEKIRKARDLIDTMGLDVQIQVDGGINPNNIGDAYEAGARNFVAGSAVFNKPSYADAISSLRAGVVKTSNGEPVNSNIKA